MSIPGRRVQPSQGAVEPNSGLVGLSLPNILPITSSFAPGEFRKGRVRTRYAGLTSIAAFAVYYVLLNLRVSLSRVKNDTYLGNDTSKKTYPEKRVKYSPEGEHDLLVQARCHANFVENVPMALLVSAIAEMNGGDRQVLAMSLVALLVFRIGHVESGLKGDRAMGWGRCIGYFGTMSYVLGISSYAAWLSKGYWGW